MSYWRRLKQRFLNRGPKYTTNFKKFPEGNGISQGQELIIRVKGAEVVTGKLYDPLTNRTYQIDQSHANDEDKDAETTNFSLKSKLHPKSLSPDYYLPVGEYVLLTWWFDYDTMRGGMFKDKFRIYPR